MTTLATMKSTRYVEPFAKEVDYWERTLSYFMETVENALNVQRQWLYLEVKLYKFQIIILISMSFYLNFNCI